MQLFDARLIIQNRQNFNWFSGLRCLLNALHCGRCVKLYFSQNDLNDSRKGTYFLNSGLNTIINPQPS